MCLVCLQTLSPPGPKKGTRFFQVPSGPSLPAVSGVNRLALAVPRCPCPGSGHSKLEGCHKANPGCACPQGSGSGDQCRVPAATQAGRAPRAAGRGPGRRARLPGGWAAATRQGRRVLLPGGQLWPGLRALSLHLSQRSRRRGGASREGSARRGHPPRRGLAASASGSPRAPPGRPGALGPTRLGYGAGEVWGRGASRDRVAPRGWAWGAVEPWGSWGTLCRGGIRVPAPCPPTRSGRLVTFVRRLNMVGAGRQPPLPLRPTGPALWASDAGRGQSRCPVSPRRTALGAGAPEQPGKPSRERRARARLPGPRAPWTRSSGPQVSDRLPPSALHPLGAGKETGSLSREPRLCSGTR